MKPISYNILKKLWVILISFLLGMNSYIEAKHISALPFFIDHYARFRYVRRNDGLCSNNILNIIQDKQGVMWFATDKGLSKYDGFHFTNYHDGLLSDNLSNNEVTSLAEDMYGNLWIGTANGLNKYDRRHNVFTKYYALNNVNSLPNNHIKALLADKLGHLWVESDGGYLSCLTIKSGRWTSIRHERGVQEGDYYYWHIFLSHNYLWIGGRAIGTQMVSLKNMSDYRVHVGNNYGRDMEGSCFAETYDQRLICPCNGYIQVYTPKTHLFNIYCSMPIEATCAISDDDKSIWIGSSKGLLHVDRDLHKGILFLNEIYNQSSLLSNQVNCIYKSRDGIIWVGTNMGVCTYSKEINKVRLYTNLNSSISGRVTALMQDRDGLLWIGTSGNGVNTLSLDHEDTRNLKYSLLTKNITKKTFYRERDIINQYALHGFIKSTKTTLSPHFSTYEQFKSSHISFNIRNENIVSSLYQDSHGKIYIGLWSHVGFNVYDKLKGSFKRYAIWGTQKTAKGLYPSLFLGDPFGSNWYNGFLEDRKGRFWCATWEGFGLNLFDRDKGMFLGKHYMINNIPRFPRGRIESMAVDRQYERIYMGSDCFLGYYDFCHNFFKRYGEWFAPGYPNRDIINRYYSYCKADLIKIPTDNICGKIAYDDRGHLFILGGGNKIYRLTVSNNKVQAACQFLKSGINTMRLSDDKQTLYVATHNNIIAIDNVENLSSHQLAANIKNKLAKHNILSLCAEKNGLFWIGTDKSLFVYNIKKRTLHAVKDNHNRDYQKINQISAYSKDDVVIGGNGSVSVLHNEKSIKTYTFTKSLHVGNIINDIYVEPTNKIWVCTNEGLVCLNNTDKGFRAKVYRHDNMNPNSLLDNEVLTVVALSPTSLWVATELGVCVFHSDTGKFEDKSMVGNDCLTSRLSSCIMQDHKGDIWIGTTQEGINVLHCDKDTIEHFVHHDWDRQGLPDNNVNCIYEDSHHKMWVGTNRGLCYYMFSGSRRFIAINELNMLKIEAVTQDHSGRLWVSTDNGLYVLSPSGKIIRCFYYYHGLQGNEFSNAVCRLKDGRLAFGGDNGFNIFNPDDLMMSTKSKPIVFSHFCIRDSVRHEDICDMKYIQLSAHDNSFSINFCAVDYIFGQHLVYRYRLKNFDRNWVYTKAPDLTAKYTNLSPGKYRFEAEVTNQYGEWDGKIYSFIVLIQTPWYFSWWFITLFVLTILFTILMIMFYREKLLRRRNKQLEQIVKERTHKLIDVIDSKNRFFNIISHDLKNPIQELEMLSTILYDNFVSSSEEEKKKYALLILDTAKHTSSLLQDLLLWSISQRDILTINKQNINLSEVVEEAISLLKPLADKKEIVICDNIDTKTMVYTDVNMVSAIFRNLLSNAIKYSYRKGCIDIKVMNEGSSYVLVYISDKGTGMNAEAQKKLFSIKSKYSTRGTEGEKGIGLGLILVKEFIIRLGEKIEVNSTIGKGTTIIFSLKNSENNEKDKSIIN